MATSTTTDPRRSVENADWVLARKGINMLINNNNTAAEEFFLKYPDSLVMYAGYSFAVFMDGLMSFEEEKLSKAISVLKEVERRCTTETGWLKSISSKVFGTTGNGSGTALTLAEELETQIILADSQVCLAILTFLQHDLSGYVKGGWVLRKAWKVYQRTYKDILTLYKQKINENEKMNLPDPIDTPQSATPVTFEEAISDLKNSDMEWDVPEQSQLNGYSYSQSNSPKFTISHSRSLDFDRNNADDLAEPSNIVDETYVNNNAKKPKRPRTLAIKKSTSINESLSSRLRSAGGSARYHISSITNTLSLSNLTSSLRDLFPGQSQMATQTIDKKTVVRLMGAVSFGYGLFQLGVSLLPPSLTKLINLLGFGSNRQNGIACLMYARLGVDMRAPLASLSLLWYHTIVRPFYAIDGVNVQAGVEAADVLIKESQKEYANSALVLFFAGRNYRLKSDITTALKSFQKANEYANQRELKLLCLHEIGWCHFIELDFQSASSTFVILKQASRWAKSFYVYMAAICTGSIPDFSGFAIFDELQKTGGGTRTGQLDEFLLRRIHCCPKDGETAKQYSAVYFKLLVFEMLYLWNALASCSNANIKQIVADCSHINQVSDEPRKGIADLILGSCYNIQRNSKKAAECFRKCLKQRSKELNNAEDAHISAFAQYELGNILIQSPETKEEGRVLLQQVSQYSHYDFEARLSVRIHSILKHLD